MGNFSAGQTNAGDNNASTARGAAVTPGTTTADVFMAQGDQQVSAAFTTMVHRAAGDDDRQTITFTAIDAAGSPQTTKVTLAAGAVADLTAAGAATAINTALQATNNAALQGIVATAKGDNSALTFSSASGSKFTVSFGVEGDSAQTAADNVTGFTADANTIKTSAQVGASNTGDIGTQSGAQAAVTALANAVSKLGDAQAAVGKGQNNFNYAINLAQSQVTNLAAAESRIRDADLASEAANLSKAQILVQAGTAALAQANSAPQAILSLLRG
jgi:flagellin